MNDPLEKTRKHLAYYTDSPIGNRCVSCGHVKHNELGYCQNGQCLCEDGTTVEGLARIILRDLPTVDDDKASKVLRDDISRRYWLTDKGETAVALLAELATANQNIEELEQRIAELQTYGPEDPD